jgi:NADH-quinone oxidoreductase subunit E
MSVRRLAEVQPATFEFTPENEAFCEKIIAKYPEGRQASAVISLLWQAQKQNGYWLPRPAIELVAKRLGMASIRVLEIATFYTMFNLEPVGRFYIQFCGTTPCLLAGSDSLKEVLQRRIGEQGKVTPDGNFSWREVECLGACCNAPMVQINDDYYEDLTAESLERLLDDLAGGRPVKAGSQTGRASSEPAGGLTSLTSLYGRDGKSGPLSVPVTPRIMDYAAAQHEFEAHNVPPAEPELERLKQEAEKSPGKPEGSIVETGVERTRVDIAAGARKAEAEVHKAAAEAAGLEPSGPADAPGAEALAPDSGSSDQKPV